MEDKVSIIIPVYNCEKYIGRCLESVLSQTYSDIEILVIDDGSQDKSLEIIRQLAQGESKIQVYHQENKGVSVARNQGLERARGKYLAFLDGDDYLGKNYIEKMVQSAKENNSELVICGYQKINQDDIVLEKIIPGKYLQFKREEWAYQITAVCSRLYKKEVWDRYKIRFEPGSRGEDVPISLFFNRICKNIVTIPFAEYYYVQHEQSAMHNFRGLHNIHLPYQSIREILERVKKVSGGNSEEFFELGMMRFFTQCIFDLGRGASKEQIYELCGFVENMMDKYFAGYWENKKSSIFSSLEIPLKNKIAVKTFMILYRMRLLYPVAKITLVGGER